MSFDELATPLFAALYNYARWLTRDPAEAEDLVQETYVKALRGFGSFTAGTNFRAWMYRILRNTFLTSKSGLKAMASIDDDVVETVAAQGTPESLPLIFREVLLLADMEEMSYREIAETLNIPIGTVTSRLLRARRKVREALR